VFRDELDAIAKTRRSRIHYLVGDHEEYPDLMNAAHLRQLVPDVAKRDVFVCGPPGMQETILASLRALRVPSRQIHAENFEL
jgi:ferredoxin-NADP reductase